MLLTDWRATHLRTRLHDLAVIPNAVVAKAEIVNHARPKPLHLHFVEFRLGYGVDPELVRRLVLAAVGPVEGVKADPPPFLLQHELETFAVLWRIWFFLDNFGRLPFIKGGVAEAIQVTLMSPELKAHLPKTLAHLQMATPVPTRSADHT